MFDPFFKKKTAFLSGISFQFRRSYFVRAFGVFSSPTLFLEGSVLDFLLFIRVLPSLLSRPVENHSTFATLIQDWKLGQDKPLLSST